MSTCSGASANQVNGLSLPSSHVRLEPPIAHADSHWDPRTRILEYRYNGRSVIHVHIPGTADVRPRIESDGEIQSTPLFQQIYLTVLGVEHVQAQVTFNMTADAVCMRPHRARTEQAVLGQVGRPLIHGVNGLYDILDDYLIDWHGRNWSWADDKMTVNPDGSLSATINIDLGYKAWIVNLRPQFYRIHLGYEYHKPWEFRPQTRSVSGWCSWEAYRREITQENIGGAAQFMARNFKPYGMEFIQVDDGYQVEPVSIEPGKSLKDSWTTMEPTFPDGHAGLVKTIQEPGMTPAIWVNTDLKKVVIPPGQPDCLLRNPDGSMLKAAFMTMPFDCTDDNIACHFRPVYQAMVDAGYKYIKVDALRHTIYDALQRAVKLGLMTNQESKRRFRRMFEVAREAMGKGTYFLASWGVFSEAVGTVDACRIATDSNPAWRKVRMQIVESARWFHTQRILFVNDPDHCCVRTKPTWGQSLLSLVSLSGGLLMLSDPIHQYDAPRVYNIQRVLPPLTTTTAETGPLDVHYQAYAWTKMHGVAFTGAIEYDWKEVTDDDAVLISGDHETMHDDHPMASLWSFHLHTPADRWCVIQRVANLPLKASTIQLQNLGLDPAATYLAFDFWSQRPLGEITATMAVESLPLGSCQVIALRKKLDHPQFLGSSRHVSNGAVELASQKWENNTLTLGLQCPQGTTEKFWIHAPKGCTLQTAAAQGAQVLSQAADADCIAVELQFDSPTATLTTSWKA